VLMKLDHVAIYGVPALAGAITALALLGPGSEQVVVGARIRGVLATGANRCAVRVHTVAHRAEVYHSMALGSVRREIEHDGAVIGSWEGATQKGGLAEAVAKLGQPLTGSTTLRLSSDGRALAEATVTVPPPLAIHGPPAPAVQTGQLPITVLVPRGFTVPPFAERLVVSTVVPPTQPTPGPAPDKDQAPNRPAPSSEKGGGPVQTPEVEPPPLLATSAEGAEVRQIGRPIRQHCDSAGCRYQWQLEVTVTAPTAQLDLEVRTADGKISAWRGALPVQPGRMWLDPKATTHGELSVQAATPKEEAYVSLVGPTGRLWGGRAPLNADERGFSSGTLGLPELPSGPLMVLLSSDASEPMDTTVAWPLRPELGSVEARPLALLADGMPALIAQEQDRRSKARRPAYGLVLTAGLFELLFLWRRGRMTRSRLRSHLRKASLTPAGAKLDHATVEAVAKGTPLLWLMLMSGGLALAFAILALVAAFA